ncbi:hypothetical protein ABFA07_005505 [Porites harrisoni]
MSLAAWFSTPCWISVLSRN